MSADLLTALPRKGTVIASFCFAGGTYTSTSSGLLYLFGDKVMRRNFFGGRRCVCLLKNVVEFVPDEAQPSEAIVVNEEIRILAKHFGKEISQLYDVAISLTARLDRVEEAIKQIGKGD